MRAASLEAIDPALDLGNGLSLAALRTDIQAAQAVLDSYNNRLAELDGIVNTLKDKEKGLELLISRLLAGIAAVYGRDSTEYEQAGGTRTSEIHRRSTPSPSS